MTSPAEKLFDEIDSLLVRLSGLREVRKDKIESLCEVDLEINEVRLLLSAKQKDFVRVTESVASTPSGADAAPEARSPSGPPGGSSEVCLHGHTSCEDCEYHFGKDYLGRGRDEDHERAGFSLTAPTEKGRERLPEIERLLAPLLHRDSF